MNLVCARRDVNARFRAQGERRTGLTTVFVTHDQGEAMDLADRVAVLNAGRIEQVGTPRQLGQTPATPFVREFLA